LALFEGPIRSEKKEEKGGGRTRKGRGKWTGENTHEIIFITAFLSTTS